MDPATKLEDHNAVDILWPQGFPRGRAAFVVEMKPGRFHMLRTVACNGTDTYFSNRYAR